MCVCARAFVFFTYVYILTHKTDNGSHLCKGRNGAKRKHQTNDKINEKGEDRSKTDTYQKRGGYDARGTADAEISNGKRAN
jgi:hypothetical protein